MQIHSDFRIPWCLELLRSNIEVVEIPKRPSRDSTELVVQEDGEISNSMFVHTLYTSYGIRAQINFNRPTSEPDAIVPEEYCYLLSIGSGLDGKTGRAHGGFSALILDQVTGTLAARVGGSAAPSTATMTVDYKAPIDTPGIILCRGWVVEKERRKVWVKASIEDGMGKIFAVGKALFIAPRENSKL